MLIAGDLVLIKYWHIKQKRVIMIPGIFVSRNLYLDDPTKNIYSILIQEPSSNAIFIIETYNKPMSCP